ncbi:hypothetical protein BKA00_002525 [Actinomadura coerulea]|uniref:Uncharacterized protein n=1 Tax=Actinomadura coerulea TaxID=46159 RepID=A0A7X0KYP0_9ACTN|nr:hypothetical protein [Actinomadura coerulea]MBB6395611.1 hypothetical protein [Actinomadura coerulea]
MPDDRPKLDVPGAISVTLGLLAVIFGLTHAGEGLGLGERSAVADGGRGAAAGLLRRRTQGSRAAGAAQRAWQAVGGLGQRHRPDRAERCALQRAAGGSAKSGCSGFAPRRRRPGSSRRSTTLVEYPAAFAFRRSRPTGWSGGSTAAANSTC